MKRFSFIFPVVILLVALVWFLINNNRLINLPVEDSPDPAPSSSQSIIHPYAIGSLVSHVPQNNQITIEKELQKQPGFTSFLVSYPSENLKLYALLNLPDGRKPTNGWPVVIVNHGYIDPQVYSTQNSYKNTSAYYARQGFLVLKPDYRSHDSSEGEVDQPFSRLQYTVDVLSLIQGVDSLNDADPDNIFLYGHSLGGDIALTISEVSPKIRAASLWAPAVTNFPESITYFTRKRRLNTPQTEELKIKMDKILEQYNAESFSSLSHINQISIPLLIHHGTADESVPYSWGQDLEKALKSSGKQITFYSYPGANHDIAQNWSTALSRDVTFFRANIKNPKN